MCKMCDKLASIHLMAVASLGSYERGVEIVNSILEGSSGLKSAALCGVILCGNAMSYHTGGSAHVTIVQQRVVDPKYRHLEEPGRFLVDALKADTRGDAKELIRIVEGYIDRHTKDQGVDFVVLTLLNYVNILNGKSLSPSVTPHLN